MAESIASACLTPVLQPFTSACDACLAPLHVKIAEFVHACLYLKRNRRRLKNRLKELKATADKVKAKVEEEEAQDRLCNPEVRQWQQKVEEIKSEAKCLIKPPREDSQRCACLSGGCNTPLGHRVRVGREVVKILQEVDELMIKVDFLTTNLTLSRPPDVVEDPLNLKKTFGMDSFLKQLRSHFEDEEKSIIGVHGLGGVGKTTLLKSFNKEMKQKNGGGYQAVIMIEVANTETLNVVGMQKRISNRLGLPWNPDESEKLRATFLLRALSRKKFVVMLDDVWKKFELEDVGIPTPNSDNGCKMIVASRSDIVCANMGAMHLIEMQCLDEDQAWNLFLSNLTEEVRAAINKDKEMNRSAMKIVTSCGGLPLALNAIGGALACHKNPVEWISVAKAMTHNPSKIDGVDEMLNILKHSYDMLKEAQKKCFLYCTLFPDYGSIKNELLVDYWVAEGLVSGSETYDGYFIISKLLSTRLLQSSDTEPSEVKMHQMIRRMGHRRADSGEDKFLIRAGQALKQAPGEQEWIEVTRISLMSNDIRDLSFSPNCRRLRTLLLQNNPNLRQLGPNFFKFMSSLKVLDLSHTGIDKLPDCGALVQLVYLNLSDTPIKELPKQLCNALVQLLYLNVSNTSISKLPEHLSKLQKLTHLYLSETSKLEVIPHGTISKLYQLRVLDLYKSNYGMQELEDLNLEGLHKLKNLGITIYSQDVLGKLKKTDPLARSTHRLSLSKCQGMESIQLSEFKRMKHLEELYIDSCTELKELIVDHVEAEESVRVKERLKVLTLAILPNLARVSFGVAPHRFQDLRDLTIRSCPKLKSVSWVLQLESLDRLVISECDGLEEVVQEETNGTSNGALCEIEEVKEENSLAAMNGEEKEEEAFPNLRIIVLRDLIELKSICKTKREFPCLESIRVEKCPNLSELPMGRIPRLKQICGETNWWAGIGQERKANLGDCFVPI
ncbi:hypothetical protein Cni_G28133 [Canna indica]|uniref:NB-ARC domain-containing protein n=1 Tax=Canna indica TaxID=4628 RepID=A0AAQ3QSW1_9LILI|nr:hypothetical protein Cni_G28133 [Canna indica]